MYLALAKGTPNRFCSARRCKSSKESDGFGVDDVKKSFLTITIKKKKIKNKKIRRKRNKMKKEKNNLQKKKLPNIMKQTSKYQIVKYVVDRHLKYIQVVNV